MNTDTTTEIIPVKNYENEAQSIIRKYVMLSTGLGFVPNPAVNVGGTATTQILMIRELCDLFKVPFQKEMVNVSLSSVVGSAISKAFGMAAAFLIPGAKPVARLNLAGGGISGLYTNTVGEFYKIHFQKGGTLQDAKISDLGRYFKEEYQRGDIGLSSFTNPMNVLKGFWGSKK